MYLQFCTLKSQKELYFLLENHMGFYQSNNGIGHTSIYDLAKNFYSIYQEHRLNGLNDQLKDDFRSTHFCFNLKQVSRVWLMMILVCVFWINQQRLAELCPEQPAGIYIYIETIFVERM